MDTLTVDTPKRKPRAKHKTHQANGQRMPVAFSGRATAKQKKIFLDKYAKWGNIHEAAAAAGVNRSSYYRWCEHDEEFAMAAKQALESYADSLETALTKRAVDGVARKKFTSRGQPVIDPVTGEQIIEHTYSDPAAFFLLKGVRPDKYRETLAVKHTGADGQDLISFGAISAAVAEYEKRKKLGE